MRFVLATLSLSLVVAVSACGDGGESGAMLHAGDTSVLVGVDDGSNMAGVGLAGTVELVGGCLGMNGWIVVWPPGTSIKSEQPLTIDVPGQGSVQVGDHLDGGGTLFDEGDPPNGVDLPDDCRGKTIVSYFPNR